MVNHTVTKKVVIYISLFLFIVVSLFPIYWMINTSFKGDAEIYNPIPTFWPGHFTVVGYVSLFTKTLFLTYLRNTLWVSSVVAFLSLVASMFAAYGIARFKFRGSGMISKSILYAYLMPRTVMYIPLYMVTVFLKLDNTLSGLILIYPTIVIPYATWMLIAYFKSIPVDMEQAAYIDGSSRFNTMVKITFPMAAPGIITTFVFSFTLCWSDYLYAMIIVSKTALKTISVGMADLIIDDLFAWGQLSAGAIFASLPIIVLYALASKYIVGGITMGAVKQ